MSLVPRQRHISGSVSATCRIALWIGEPRRLRIGRDPVVRADALSATVLCSYMPLLTPVLQGVLLVRRRRLGEVGSLLWRLGHLHTAHSPMLLSKLLPHHPLSVTALSAARGSVLQLMRLMAVVVGEKLGQSWRRTRGRAHRC